MGTGNGQMSAKNPGGIPDGAVRTYLTCALEGPWTYCC